MPDTDEREARAERLAAIERDNDADHTGYSGASYNDVAWLIFQLRTADAALSALREREEEVARYEFLASGYVAADFAYPQYEGRPVLIFALPYGSKVSANLDATLDAAARALQENDR